MGRTRLFNREDVMDEALKEFWSQGYERTSLEDLLSVMAIKNSSFYQAFKSKEELFLNLVLRYRATWGRKRVEILTDPERTARESLEDYFHHAIYSNTKRGYPVGCFMTSTVASLTDSKSRVGREALVSMRNIENNFRIALLRGQKAKQTTGLIEVRAGARLLTTYLTGMTSISRTGKTKKELMNNAMTLINLLLKKK